MRIPCPYCGPRGNEEFTYLGDATVRRPDPATPGRRAGVPRLRLSARQSVRAAPRALVSRRRLPHVARGDARHAHARDQRRDVRATAEAGRERRIASAQRRPDRPRAGRCRSRFDGETFSGFAGDTLASALLANGVRLVGRSFKYHRPRGILTAGSEEPNALVELRTGARREPNTRATTAELYDGLDRREPEPLAVAAPSTSAR